MATLSDICRDGAGEAFAAASAREDAAAVVYKARPFGLQLVGGAARDARALLYRRRDGQAARAGARPALRRSHRR